MQARRTVGFSVWVMMICCLGLIPHPSQAEQDDGLKIYNVLPKDAIRAVLKPEFVSVEDAQVADYAAMIGVVLNGEAHAYSAVLLNSHEVVNDTVGGAKVATTW